eukprot:scaffold3340_cov255-Pinguiococcus_pyrenoidosus.AAC.12
MKDFNLLGRAAPQLRSASASSHCVPFANALKCNAPERRVSHQKVLVGGEVEDRQLAALLGEVHELLQDGEHEAVDADLPQRATSQVGDALSTCVFIATVRQGPTVIGYKEASGEARRAQPVSVRQLQLRSHAALTMCIMKYAKKNHRIGSDSAILLSSSGSNVGGVGGSAGESQPLTSEQSPCRERGRKALRFCSALLLRPRCFPMPENREEAEGRVVGDGQMGVLERRRCGRHGQRMILGGLRGTRALAMRCVMGKRWSVDVALRLRSDPAVREVRSVGSAEAR